MKKILFTCMCSVLVLLIVLVLYITISPPGKDIIKTAETKKFINSIIKSDDNIKKATIFIQNAALQFDYTVKDEPTEEELTNIFNFSYNFLMNDDKLKDLVLKGSKSVCIYINFKEDRYEYNATSFLYNNSDDSRLNSETYNTWTLFKNNVVVDTFRKNNNLYKK